MATTMLFNDILLQKDHSFSNYAITTLAISLVILPLAFAYQILLSDKLSGLRRIPRVPQAAAWNRLLTEPNGEDFLRWFEEVPNDGLLRYYGRIAARLALEVHDHDELMGVMGASGVLNGERILTTTTEAAKVIHDNDTNDYRRPAATKAIVCRMTGDSIFAAEGSVHAAQRKEMLPAFKFRHLKDLYPTFWAKTKELVASLNRECNGRSAVVGVDEWFNRGK